MDTTKAVLLRKKQVSILKRRAKIYATCQDPAKATAIYLRCRQDPCFFINSFIWDLDPRNADKGLPTYFPFVLYPRQAELVEWIQDLRRDGVTGNVPKARGVGATATCMAYSIWLWLFHDGVTIGWGSKKEKLVDESGNPNSIFEKMRKMIARLPKWLMTMCTGEGQPGGYNFDKHSNNMRIVNPKRMSAMIGEAGKGIGRGGRATIFFTDEYAHLENPMENERSLLMVTNCQVRISTPNGLNEFHSQVTAKNARNFYMNWESVPWRDAEWLKHKTAQFAHDTAGLAQEIHIDFQASVDGVCLPSKWIKAGVNYLDLQTYKGDLTPHAGYDVGLTADSNVVAIKRGPILVGLEEWGEKNTNASTHKVVGICNDNDIEYLFFDGIGIGAGVAGTLEEDYAHEECDGAGCDDCGFTGRGYSFIDESVRTADPASDNYWSNGKVSKDFIFNLRAEMWWTIRERFRKTYENRELGGNHPLDECISIPDDQRIINELGVPKYTKEPKYRIESKKLIRKRLGGKSIDVADAIVLAFASDSINVYADIQT